uniref:(northern house mosquito) hypothetical protein n=1 Tax=Culex pipiens TaxID=7175 RepID=A0A8D8PD88_CULPI
MVLRRNTNTTHALPLCSPECQRYVSPLPSPLILFPYQLVKELRKLLRVRQPLVPRPRARIRPELHDLGEQLLESHQLFLDPPFVLRIFLARPIRRFVLLPCFSATPTTSSSRLPVHVHVGPDKVVQRLNQFVHPGRLAIVLLPHRLPATRRIQLDHVQHVAELLRLPIRNSLVRLLLQLRAQQNPKLNIRLRIKSRVLRQSLQKVSIASVKIDQNSFQLFQNGLRHFTRLFPARPPQNTTSVS